MEEQLSAEIHRLGDMLGETIDLLAPPGTKSLVEKIRSLAKARRKGDASANLQLLDMIEGLQAHEIPEIVRAFGIYFDLANLAEDRHRVRVLRTRENASHPAPRGESIGAAVVELRRQGLPADAVQSLLGRLSIEPVFTAHPTEAKRRSLREKIRDLREHLDQLDAINLTPRQRDQLLLELRTDLALLWQTDFLRERRPTVLEELERSLFFFETLWQVVPELYRDLELHLNEQYPSHRWEIPTFLRFATWIGGDRDGNPNVTWEVTARAMARLRSFVLAKHIRQCRLLRRSLSLSAERAPASAAMLDYLQNGVKRWSQLETLIAPIAPSDRYRQFLRMIQWRLEQTLTAQPFQAVPDGAYRNAEELSQELDVLQRSLTSQPGGALFVTRLESWRRQIAVFGFHAMRMDVRQESGWYLSVMDDVFRHLGIVENFSELDEPARQRWLTQSLGTVSMIDWADLKAETQETLQLFRLLAESVRINGQQALGCHMISMTRNPSDVLAVLWLSHWAARQFGLGTASLPLPIVPLFETIDDLNNSGRTVAAILAHPAYADQVKRDGFQQTIMIGYSDSTKDGGYLAAAWAQLRAQLAITAEAKRHGVRIMFFHGRGGALGRGGGPAARSVLSSPSEIIDASMRLTEQGEVLSARYDDPRIAKRHLEQLIWATMLVSVRESQPIPESWRVWMDEIARLALAGYRELVTMSGFIDYFDQATPIGEIEQLPIGSRPPRRSGQRSLDKLRAIPWVFSWTQNRQLLPAWYGVGRGLGEFLRTQPDGLAKLQEMYRAWPFFEGLIENAALALAKADLAIGREYVKLVDDSATAETIWKTIESDFRASVDSVLQIAGRNELLEQVPWLRESIEVRNPYVDPLNLMQVSLLKRLRECEPIAPDVCQTALGQAQRPPIDVHERAVEVDNIKSLVRATIQGIAAGLRTTG